MKKHSLSYLAILTLLTLPLNAALIAEYDFGDGTLLDDTSGEGHNLTQTGTAALNGDGYSVQLDDAEYLTATTLDNSSSAYTISLWFNPAA